MADVQTAGVPPKTGNAHRAAMGWTRKSKAAETNSVQVKIQAMAASVPDHTTMHHTMIPFRQTGPFDAVICDIDGCLTPEDGGPAQAELLARIAAHNREAIATGHGPVVTLCSGRPIPFVEALCRVIANTVLPAIGEMGVWIYNPRTQLMSTDPAITSAHRRAVAEASAWIVERFSSEPLFQQPGKACSISLFHEDTAYLMSLLPELRAQCEDRGWPLRVSSTWCWVNLDLVHISKATGIDRLCALTGLEHDRLAGIGDTMGDLAIRERVTWFGCPSNAAQGLKDHADTVSDQPEAAGVLDLLAGLPV